MDNEVYESQLNIDITPFEKAIQRITSVFTGLTSKLEKKHKLQIDIAEQVQDIQTMEKEYLKLTQAIFKNGDDTAKTRQEWETYGRAIGIGNSQLEKMKEELADVQSQSSNIGKSASSFPKTFKQLAGAIIGVRSVYAGFNKIVSSSLSQNAELANKFSAIWQALGNAITPILQKIANAILTLFSYLNIFIKTLTGGKVDILGKAMATANKNTKATSKSAKELNKQLAGFDELQNIDDNAGSGSAGGVGGGLDIGDAFKDVKIDTSWADRIETFGEWVRVNWPLVVSMLGGTWGAFKSGMDISEWAGLMLILAGAYEFFKGLKDVIDGLSNGNLDLVADGFKKIALGIALVSVGLALFTGNWNILYGLIIAGVALIASWFAKHWEEIKQAFIDIVDAMAYQWEGFKTTVSNIVQAVKDWVVNKWNEIKEGWNTMVENIKTKWENFKTNVVNKVEEIKTGIKNRIDSIKQFWTTLVDTVSTKWNNLKTNIINKFEEVKTSIKEKINGIIGFFEGLANKGVQAINKIITSLNKVKFDIPSWVPVIGGKSFGFNLSQVSEIKLARLDTGTNYVPNDMIAQIHKGEAVIPKKFNSDEFFGGNQELLDKLDTFMGIVENIDLQPYITVKDIGQTATKYQTQQVRILGGV